MSAFKWLKNILTAPLSVSIGIKNPEIAEVTHTPGGVTPVVVTGDPTLPKTKKAARRALGRMERLRLAMEQQPDMDRVRYATLLHEYNQKKSLLRGLGYTVTDDDNSELHAQLREDV